MEIIRCNVKHPNCTMCAHKGSPCDRHLTRAVVFHPEDGSMTWLSLVGTAPGSDVDQPYVEVISYIDDPRRNSWREPNTEAMRKMVDQFLRDAKTGLKRRAMRWEHRRTEVGGPVTGSVWRYDLTGA